MPSPFVIRPGLKSVEPPRKPTPTDVVRVAHCPNGHGVMTPVELHGNRRGSHCPSCRYTDPIDEMGIEVGDGGA